MLCSSHPACLLINHLGCDCFCHSCRHLETKDVSSSHRAVLPSLTAFKEKHLFFSFFLVWVLSLFFFFCAATEEREDLRSSKKSCTAFLSVAVAGSWSYRCSSRVRVLKRVPGSNLPCKSHCNSCRVGLKTLCQFPTQVCQGHM